MQLSNNFFILPLLFAIIGTPLAFAQVDLNHVDIFCPNEPPLLDFTAIFQLLEICPIDTVGQVDTDGDGLLDDWEINGIPIAGGGVFILDGADPMHADIYVEIDHMTGRAPSSSEINDVINAFANSPYQNPDSTTGINLHVDSLSTSDEIPFADEWTFVDGFWPNFDSAKLANFGTQTERGTGTPEDIARLDAKKQAYHYTIFINHRNGTSSTGIAERFGNDSVVALGPILHFIPGLQSGTFMHELGHNLDLAHGGDDGINCKPNYLSVMNYARQSPWTLKFFGSSIVNYMTLDYSQSNLATLNENSLDEPDGVEASTPPGLQTLIGPAPFISVIPTGVPHNWDIDIFGDTTTLGVQRDINFILPANPLLRLCPDEQGFQILNGHDDWKNLKFNFQDNVNTFDDGVHLDLREEEIEGDVLEAYVNAVNNLNATKDSFLRQGTSNTNEGSNEILQIRASGNNRALVEFDQNRIEIAAAGETLHNATLRLYIEENFNNWGPNGRTIDVHNLSEGWAEGNGWNFENNIRGNETGVTWKCAIDEDISNHKKDCDTQWSGGTFDPTPTDTITIFKDNPGTGTVKTVGWIEFDVTADVQAFIDGTEQNHGWIIKKTLEGQPGRLQFTSSEGITNHPQLVLTFEN